MQTLFLTSQQALRVADNIKFDHTYCPIKKQKRKGLTEMRAREYGLWAEAFFCLDFFWYFFVSSQKRTSPAAIERGIII